MRAPLTRKALDKLTCQAPGCTHESHDGLVLHGACHIQTPSTARYQQSGVIEISCGKCEKWIAAVAIHPEERAAMNAAIVCRDPSCKEPPESHSIVFRAPCHRDQGVIVTYQRGHLMIACGKCKEVVDAHHVAEGTATA